MIIITIVLRGKTYGKMSFERILMFNITIVLRGKNCGKISVG